jgi:hypothetical protein
MLVVKDSKEKQDPLALKAMLVQLAHKDIPGYKEILAHKETSESKETPDHKVCLVHPAD